MSEPIPVCCALIECDSRVLIAQRPPHKHLGGEWEFPGGKIETQESPREAVVREIQEELGCAITTIRALPPSVHHYPGVSIALHPFVARLETGSPEPQPHEHTALNWLDRSALRTARLAPADLPVVDAYLRSLD